MNKQKNRFILFIALIIGIIYVGIYTLSIKLEPGDTIWNFGTIYKIYNGEKMYTDIGIVITSLFFQIGKIIFDIFGANFFVYQIYNYIIVLGMVFLTYKILDVLNVKSLYKILAIIIILEIRIFAVPNYNILAILFMEIGILIDLKISNNKYKNILHGIICAIVFFINQKNGAGYLLAVIMTRIVNYKFNKKTILDLVCTGLVFLFGILVGLLFLYINNNLNDFINVCILGIIDFNSNNFVITFDSIYLLIYLVLIIFSVLIFRNNKDVDARKNIIVLLMYAIGEMIVIYPLFNSWHIKLGFILFIILFIYNITVVFGDALQKPHSHYQLLCCPVVHLVAVNPLHTDYRTHHGMVYGLRRP